MSNKGWLVREDFEKLDLLFQKLGYGGYYDFLECLKNIASRIGAYSLVGGEFVPMANEFKTIPALETLLTRWSFRVNQFRNVTPDWDNTLLNRFTERDQINRGRSNA